MNIKNYAIELHKKILERKSTTRTINSRNDAWDRVVKLANVTELEYLKSYFTFDQLWFNSFGIHCETANYNDIQGFSRDEAILNIEKKHKEFLDDKALPYRWCKESSGTSTRNTHCYRCKNAINSNSYYECVACWWIICSCWACWCWFLQ